MTAAAFLLAPASGLGADRKIEPVKVRNDAAEVTGSVILGTEAVKAALGVDPAADLVIVQLKVRPIADSGFNINRDDFILISRSDGQKCPALHPSQIAGGASLKVQSTGPGAQGGIMSPRRGPVWGGIPGTGDRPRRMGGDNDVAAVTEAETKTTVNDSTEKDNPVMSALKAKELQQGQTPDAVSGFLYFILEGKQKLKNLDLLIRTSAGNLLLDFQK